MPVIEPLSIDDIIAARTRIGSIVTRTPLVRLQVDAPAEIYLKLENVQPIGSFKIRGAMNAIRMLPKSALADGVYTASAGNMAQGVAWGARELGIPCAVVMPDSAPGTKLEAVARLGATIVQVPFDEWWKTLQEHGRAGMPGTFIHPVANRSVIAGNGTIGIEIAADLPEVDTVLVPFGGGGLSTGIATAIRTLAPRAKVFGCEVATSIPLSSAFAAGKPVAVERTPSFVDGIGGRGVLSEMWPLVSSVLDGAVIAELDEVKRAVRLLAERARVIAEGAGAVPVASALAGRAGRGKIVCVVSGGNIDTKTLIELLSDS